MKPKRLARLKLSKRVACGPSCYRKGRTLTKLAADIAEMQIADEFLDKNRAATKDVNQ